MPFEKKYAEKNYAPIAEFVRETTHARHVFVLVVDGDAGTSYATSIAGTNHHGRLINTAAVAGALSQIAEDLLKQAYAAAQMTDDELVAAHGPPRRKPDPTHG